MQNRSNDWLMGNRIQPASKDFSDGIAWSDHKISFALKYSRGKDVLDLGCVQHNPENYKSKFWLHKALIKVSRSVDGMDLYEEGAKYLNDMNYNVIVGDVQSFSIGKEYDVIVAGDLIEHLENLSGFLRSCKAHLRTGGRILISTPNPWYWRNVAKAIFFGRVNANPEHTLWMCPTVLGQLVTRHDMEIEEWHYGSRYFKDKVMPFPKGIKHPSFHAAIRALNKG
jgi:2-polyprenyl-3-methyl-5-hydroxy-6-metoxy-1,4-benzoquinol methylase